MSLRTTRTDGELEIRVSDTGQGIAPGFVAHVFEPFRQASAGTTRTDAGLGLGLAIVRHLVHLHGGTVRAESRGLGLGATFIVRLPAATGEPAEVKDKPERAQDAGGVRLDGGAPWSSKMIASAASCCK